MQGRSSEQLMELLLEEMHQERKLLHFPYSVYFIRRNNILTIIEKQICQIRPETKYIGSGSLIFYSAPLLPTGSVGTSQRE